MAIDKVPQFDNKPPLAGGIQVPPSMRCPRLMLINSASLWKSIVFRWRHRARKQAKKAGRI